MRRSLRVLAVFLLGVAGWPGLAAGASPPAPVPATIPIAMLVDLSTGQTIYAREIDRRFVPASVTKVMTAYSAFALAASGHLPLRRRFAYPVELERQWFATGSSMFLRAGEQPTIAQLLLGVTTVSGNDASVALGLAAAGSQEAWLAVMNENAARLGMNDTYFGSPNGYPDGGQTYTTARDLVALGSDLITRFPELYGRFFGHRQMTWGGITQTNHDPVTGRVEGADGIKTGYTSEAGYTFLGSAERNGRRLVVVLAGAPTSAARDEAARALLEWGFAHFTPRLIFPAGSVIGTALVQDGAARQVGLRVPSDLNVALPHAGLGRGKIRLEISYRGPVAAPIMAGDMIARLKLRLDGREVLDMPLEATEAVPQAGLFWRIANAVSRWLA